MNELPGELTPAKPLSFDVQEAIDAAASALARALDATAQVPAPEQKEEPAARVVQPAAGFSTQQSAAKEKRVEQATNVALSCAEDGRTPMPARRKSPTKHSKEGDWEAAAANDPRFGGGGSQAAVKNKGGMRGGKVRKGTVTKNHH